MKATALKESVRISSLLSSVYEDETLPKCVSAHEFEDAGYPLSETPIHQCQGQDGIRYFDPAWFKIVKAQAMQYQMTQKFAIRTKKN
jgi:hypothetical protein